MLDFMASWFTPTTLFCVLNLMIGIIFITSNLKSHHHKPPPSPSPDDEYHHHHHHHPLLRAPSILERVRSFNFSLYSSEQQPDNDPLHFSPFHLDPHQQPNYHPPQLVRAPSLLERVRSFNLSLYRSEQQPDTDPLQFSTHHLDPQQPDDEDEHNKKNNNPPQLVRAPSLLERVKSFNFSLYRSEQPDPVQHETHHVEEAHVTRRSKSDKTGEGPGPGPGPAKMKSSASQKARAAAEEKEEEKVDRRRPATLRERNAAAAYGEEEEEVDAKADDFINRFKQQLKLQRLDSILRYRDMLNRGSGRMLLLESFGVKLQVEVAGNCGTTTTDADAVGRR
ncbi:hypothetical protein CsSME_00050827 [Camellia sinensis var. sinensis]